MTRLTSFLTKIENSAANIVILFLIVLLATALRFVFSDHSLWVDEYASVFFASRPLEQLWSTWMVIETNPPLFYTILHGWMELIGPMSGAWLRVPSIIASVLAVPVVFFGVKRIYGTHAALAAALMIGISAQQIEYAEHIRAYSTLFLALAVSFFGLLAIVHSSETGERAAKFAWAAYGAGAVIAVYLHTTAIFWPAIATLSLMLVDARFRPFIGTRWATLVLVYVVIMLGAAWWIYITYIQTITPNGNISWIEYSGLRETLELIKSSIFLVRNPKNTVWIVIGLVLFGLIRTRSSAATRFIAVCWFVAILTYLIVSQKQPILLERTLLWMTLFPLTLAAAGLGTIRNPLVFWLGTAGIALLLLMNLAKNANFMIEDWRTSMMTVANDPDGALIVGSRGEALSASEACRIELRQFPCPFAIVTLIRTGPRAKTWADGHVPNMPMTQEGALALSPRTNAYLLNRGPGQALTLLNDANMLRNVQHESQLLLGPYGPPFITNLVQKSRVVDGLLEIPVED